MDKKAISYFTGSILSLVVAVVLGYTLGSWETAWTIFVLAVLEISLSFDNAVVNASVLNGWSHFWRQLFLLVGLPIAVFGMRFVFPIVIVSFTTGMSMLAACSMALHQPAEYAKHLIASHHQVAAFGGTFLMMVALQFFIDEEKEHHWLLPMERYFAKFGEYQVAVETGITFLVLMLSSLMLHGHEKNEFIAAGVWGFITYIGAKLSGQLLGGGGEVSNKVAQGIGGLMYLEILDASFSFDGVIGAFAITNKLFVIMAGLGVGAMFVRSLTIYLVERGTLNEYRFLEHGAFWAILALAIIMFVGVSVEIPETLTGFIGMAFIVLSFWSSVRLNKKEADEINESSIPEAQES